MRRVPSSDEDTFLVTLLSLIAAGLVLLAGITTYVCLSKRRHVLPEPEDDKHELVTIDAKFALMGVEATELAIADTVADSVPRIQPRAETEPQEQSTEAGAPSQGGVEEL